MVAEPGVELCSALTLQQEGRAEGPSRAAWTLSYLLIPSWEGKQARRQQAGRQQAAAMERELWGQ